MPKAVIVQPGGGFDRIVVGEREASPPEPARSPFGSARVR
jgi:hypothetical protein